MSIIKSSFENSSLQQRSESDHEEAKSFAEKNNGKTTKNETLSGTLSSGMRKDPNALKDYSLNRD